MTGKAQRVGCLSGDNLDDGADKDRVRSIDCGLADLMVGLAFGSASLERAGNPLRMLVNAAMIDLCH